MRMSLRYTMILPFTIKSLKMLFINARNMLGEFVKPKNIIVNLNRPQFVVNAAFHLSPVLM